MPTNPNQARCEAARRDGQPCTAPALPSGYCWAHDPDRAAEREAARQRGGKHRANVHRLRTAMPSRLVPVFDMLEGALVEVHDGTLDPKQASAMAAVARAMCAVLNVGEMELRMRDIEAKLG